MLVKCIHCGTEQEIDSDLAGKVVECSACQEPVSVPRADQGIPHCSNCAAEMAAGTVVCLSCGFNMTTGKFLQTRVEEEEEPIPLWHRLMNLIVDAVPGAFRPLLLVTAIICFVASFFIMQLGIMILGLVAIEGILIMATAVVIYAQGLAILFSGTLQFLSHAMNDFERQHWYYFSGFLLGPFLIIFLLMMYYGPKLAQAE